METETQPEKRCFFCSSFMLKFMTSRKAAAMAERPVGRIFLFLPSPISPPLQADQISSTPPGLRPEGNKNSLETLS